MVCYPSGKRGMVRGFFVLLFVGVLIGGLVTAFDEPEAIAATSPGGIPVRVSFNPNFPARVGQPCQLCVELDAAFFNDVTVNLSYPAKMNPDMGTSSQELAQYPATMTIPANKKGDCIPVTLARQGWVGVVARANGGSAGGVLEIQP